MAADIVPGSAAEKAGLRPGDIIVAINGKPVVSAAQLRTRIRLKRVGESIEIEFLRGGDRVTAKTIVTATAS
jgi:S1-C subfamily serine protease